MLHLKNKLTAKNEMSGVVNKNANRNICIHKESQTLIKNMNERSFNQEKQTNKLGSNLTLKSTGDSQSYIPVSIRNRRNININSIISDKNSQINP